jgi:hypothetical protein
VPRVAATRAPRTCRHCACACGTHDISDGAQPKLVVRPHLGATLDLEVELRVGEVAGHLDDRLRRARAPRMCRHGEPPPARRARRRVDTAARGLGCALAAGCKSRADRFEIGDGCDLADQVAEDVLDLGKDLRHRARRAAFLDERGGARRAGGTKEATRVRGLGPRSCELSGLCALRNLKRLSSPQSYTTI